MYWDGSPKLPTTLFQHGFTIFKCSSQPTAAAVAGARAAASWEWRKSLVMYPALRIHSDSTMFNLCGRHSPFTHLDEFSALIHIYICLYVYIYIPTEHPDFGWNYIAILNPKRVSYATWPWTSPTAGVPLSEKRLRANTFYKRYATNYSVGIS